MPDNKENETQPVGIGAGSAIPNPWEQAEQAAPANDSKKEGKQ
jgi:hypothetical protein